MMFRLPTSWSFVDEAGDSVGDDVGHVLPEDLEWKLAYSWLTKDRPCIQGSTIVEGDYKMNPFTAHRGRVAPLDRVNVDTDQIIPKQFLKRIERTGFGQFLFYDWRFGADGKKNADFVLDEPRYQGASILVAGRNFGCGSSREHAVWALADFGFRAVISSSFADIFANNSTKNGFLAVRLSEEEAAQIMQRAQATDYYQVTIDLEKCEVRDDGDFRAKFPMDEFVRHCLLNGLDDIGLTLQHEAEIAAYESQHPTPAALCAR
jgi:3-isopropylmalate/(R)-2-methylmalate dehydratase small subunit